MFFAFRFFFSSSTGMGNSPFSIKGTPVSDIRWQRAFPTIGLMALTHLVLVLALPPSRKHPFCLM
jgi:hypothetical protein